MPKVMLQYLTMRRQQVLDAAGACFARNGFHQTTMQDICGEAELSPGAVYRYFRGKEEIIEAIGEEARQRNLELIEAAKREAAEHEGDTLQIFAGLARAFFFTTIDEEHCSLDIELHAEARRSPHIQETLRRGSEAVRTAMAALIRGAQGNGEVNPNLDPEAVARILMSMHQGFILQKQHDPELDVQTYVDAALAMVGGSFWRGRQTA